MTRKFTGAITALVTPFTDDDKIDFEALEILVKEQIEANCGILINGTTGESPTLEEEEVVEIANFVREKAKGKVPFIIGSGTNSTKKSIAKSQLAENLGADAILVVNPYYNKPGQEGLYQHFKAVANSVNIPVIIYNIKGRTGVNVETDTLMKLAEINNIIGVKEASGNLEQIKEVCERRPENFSVLLGDDAITYKCMTEYGADGVISVVSNAYPREISNMCRFILEENLKEASAINDKFQPMMQGALSIGTNPEGIKAILALQGKIKEKLRLPMCSLNSDNKNRIKEFLK